MMQRGSGQSEIRVVVAADMRGKRVGRLLIQETFRIALQLRLEKLIAPMTVDQRGAFAVFESMGFRGEALLRDHVNDRAGIKHDLVILSHVAARFQSQMEAYGLSEAPCGGALTCNATSPSRGVDGPLRVEPGPGGVIRDTSA